MTAMPLEVTLMNGTIPEVDLIELTAVDLTVMVVQLGDLVVQAMGSKVLIVVQSPDNQGRRSTME